VFWPIAAGASNHAGKGGGSSGGGGAPWITARGQIPPDSGNSNAFGIEAANNGTGEVWPKAQTDAYVVMCAALSAGYGLVIASDYRSHAEWSPPRKIDPRGPAPWQPANASAPWNMNAFRSDVAAAASGAGPIPTPPPEDDMPRLSNPLIQATGKDGSLSGAVYLTDGALMSYRWVRDPQELSDVQYKLRVAGLPDGIEVVDNLAAFGNEDGPAPSMAAVQTLAAELES
jgi:hypothetical protein